MAAITEISDHIMLLVFQTIKKLSKIEKKNTTEAIYRIHLDLISYLKISREENFL